MVDKIKIFENAQFGQIRASYTESGEPLFCLADVCKALDLGNPSQVKMRLSSRGVISSDPPPDNAVKGIVGVEVPTYNQHGALVMQRASFITEPLLYKCIFQSRKKEAEQFQDWVCEDVLPSIRKAGGYLVARPDESPEVIMARALLLAKETIDKQAEALQEAQGRNRQLQEKNDVLTTANTEQEQQIRKMLPGAMFARAVMTSEKSILVGELARILRQNGIDIGQNRLFLWLRESGYLVKKGEMYNQPTQKALDMGLFEMKKTVVQKPSGETLISNTTKVTGKGQVYFVNKFLSESHSPIPSC